MAKKKYPISKEFFPFNMFAPPISRSFVLLAQMGMKASKFMFKDSQLDVQSRMIPGYQGTEIEALILTSKDLPKSAPCILHIHGGGFVFEGSNSHFRLAMTSAKEARCKAVYVRYRPVPRHPFPVPQENCFAALCWIYDHADELGIDCNRIGVTGDSAVGMLTVTSCMMARDRGAAVRPLFQLLVYPWLDNRNTSDSCRRFPDTPCGVPHYQERLVR